jgi:hypothetical protein
MLIIQIKILIKNTKNTQNIKENNKNMLLILIELIYKNNE